ncbi:MAG: PQQ-dependent sugar dehydrogenase [Pseudomonadota bacterium]
MRNVALFLLAISAMGASATDYQLETLVDDLSNPWSIAFLPDGDFLIAERDGQIQRLRPDGSRQSLAGVPETYFAGQGGFFDILLDPEFTQNRTVYLSYAHGTSSNNGTGVIRARLGEAGLENSELILLSEPARATPQHYGGRLLFLPDGSLLVTVGDGFEYREAAQDVDQQLGKILRIYADGSVPPDNPFFARGGPAAKVWTYGHRNSQGLALGVSGEEVFMHEHGPYGGDEVNHVLPGKNYGWPAVTKGIDYSGAYVSPFTEHPSMEAALISWSPSIAPSGFAVYSGEAFPEWQGSLFVGALVNQEVRRLTLKEGRIVAEEALFAELEMRIRDIRQGPDELLYILTDEGSLVRVKPD